MSAKRTRTLFLDTNVFVAAVKHPRRRTGTLRLLLEILTRDEVELVGNELWLEEMVRYAEEFQSETASWLVGALLKKTRFVTVKSNYLAACRAFVTTPDPADLLHAATCLQEAAVLVSNDKHFDRVRDEGVVKVWSIAKAIRSL